MSQAVRRLAKKEMDRLEGVALDALLQARRIRNWLEEAQEEGRTLTPEELEEVKSATHVEVTELLEAAKRPMRRGRGRARG